MNPEAEQSLEAQLSAEAVVQSRSPLSSSLRWYLRIVFFMPTMVCVSLAMLLSFLRRLPWVSHWQIDGDWLLLAYLIVICVSTFGLGLFHSHLHYALHLESTPEGRFTHCWHAIKFCIVQIAVVPLTIVAMSCVLSVFWW